MNIGEIARLSGLPAKTIRYYEEIDLVQPQRDANGYRRFRQSDLHRLSFLGRARSLGFTIEDCRTLMQLYADKGRASADVKSLAEEHLCKIEQKLTELAEMRATLSHLIDACAGDDRPDCPILADLAAAAGETPAAAAPPARSAVGG